MLKVNLKKLEAFDLIYFRCKNCFEEDAAQNLVFQPMLEYYKNNIGIGNGNYIYLLKSSGLSDEDNIQL